MSSLLSSFPFSLLRLNHSARDTFFGGKVKSTYRKGSEIDETEAVDQFIAPDVLILDEIGVQIGSEHEKMLLFDIINQRYEQCKSTILISNLDQSELTAYLGDRVMDRFRETGAVVAFDWTSYRGKAAA